MGKWSFHPCKRRLSWDFPTIPSVCHSDGSRASKKESIKVLLVFIILYKIWAFSSLYYYDYGCFFINESQSIIIIWVHSFNRTNKLQRIKRYTQIDSNRRTCRVMYIQLCRLDKVAFFAFTGIFTIFPRVPNMQNIYNMNRQWDQIIMFSGLLNRV